MSTPEATSLNVAGGSSDGPRAYVVGFLFSEPSGLVALVRKNRPDWQAGRLNGIGGKVEAGETPSEAMRREFHEEAGLDLEGWEHFATVEAQNHTGGRIFFYRLVVEDETFSGARTMTDEPIETHVVAAVVPTEDVLPNLSWLLPLARYRHDTYEPLIARERLAA